MTSSLVKALTLLEIACFNTESAFIAQQAGADRIELCDDFAVGGTTPDVNTVMDARVRITIPVFVMIRPGVGTLSIQMLNFSK